MTRRPSFSLFFFFNDTATTEIYTLSLHDALPICSRPDGLLGVRVADVLGPAPGHGHEVRDRDRRRPVDTGVGGDHRSEEHTSELQSLAYLVCRLLLEKKKKYTNRECLLYLDIK